MDLIEIPYPFLAVDAFAAKNTVKFLFLPESSLGKLATLCSYVLNHWETVTKKKISFIFFSDEISQHSRDAEEDLH